MSTPERKCIGEPEQNCIRDERQKAPAGTFWRFSRIRAGGVAVVARIRRGAWERDASVPAEPARWFDCLKLREVEVADGPQDVGGSAVLLIARQHV